MGLIDEIPEKLGEALGASDPAYTGGVVISAVILGVVGVMMAQMKVNIMGIVIILLAAMGALTVIGWLDWWLLVLTALIIGILFATKASGMGSD